MGKGIDFSKDNVYDAIGRPDLKPVSDISTEEMKQNHAIDKHYDFNDELICKCGHVGSEHEDFADKVSTCAQCTCKEYNYE